MYRFVFGIKLGRMSMTMNEINQAVEAIMALRPIHADSVDVKKTQSLAEVKRRRDQYRYRKELEAIENGEASKPMKLDWRMLTPRLDSGYQ